MKKRSGVIFRLLLISLVLLSGLSAEIEAVKKVRTFAIIYPVVNPFFDETTNSAEAMAKKLGCKLLITGPDKFDIQQQIGILKNLIASRWMEIGIGPTRRRCFGAGN